MAATKHTMSSSPIVKVISSAVSCEKPRLMKRCWRFGAIPLVPVHRLPCEKPSKLVVPIITHRSATVPGTVSRCGVPDSGGGRGGGGRRAARGGDRGERGV